MVKKTITYTDYDGNERTEDFYFNLSNAEVMEANLNMEGGLKAYIEQIIAAKDQLKLVKLFKEVLMMSVGKKSPDGRLFLKNDQIRAEFEASPAYSKIYMGLLDAEEASAFINGVIGLKPEDVNPAMNMAATANAVPALNLG